MPIPQYSVLIGRAVDRKFATTASNHYEIHIKAAGVSFRIAVLDPNRKTVDGVSYSKEQASRAGWTVVF
jgi:hypothetical protein